MEGEGIWGLVKANPWETVQISGLLLGLTLYALLSIAAWRTDVMWDKKRAVLKG